MSSGSALGAAARGGGKTIDFLSEHAMIEHRTAALASGQYELIVTAAKGKGCATLAVTFRAVRKAVCEHVQLLDREELTAFMRCLASKGSSRRGANMSHLLSPSAMAARSPAVLWSVAHAFDGDVQGGVEILLTGL